MSVIYITDSDGTNDSVGMTITGTTDIATDKYLTINLGVTDQAAETAAAASLTFVFTGAVLGGGTLNVNGAQGVSSSAIAHVVDFGRIILDFVENMFFH